MNAEKHDVGDVCDTHEGGSTPPCTGLAPDVHPEVKQPLVVENVQKGMSTNYALSEPVLPFISRDSSKPHWYALRATYGRAEKAYSYFIAQGVEAYYPTIKAFRMVNGKRKKITEARLPNIFFVRGTETVIKSYVYDNTALPYLRFYCRRSNIGRESLYEPLVIPDRQIDSLRIICAYEEGGNVIVPPDEHKFEKGQNVRVIAGNFKGVVGKVARYCGQLRVAVTIEGLLTIATAYVPRNCLQVID